ncbi:MAG: MiaB/RimO family radical SAM methylthiotransferase [Candidatus Omnitrophica bacterium]|nr:MiaB/RimO family radical SAM methylthiotransferase [Candidatus Omnitrophota bacterium]
MKNSLAVGIISLGCPRNLVDSETIVSILSQRGHRLVSPEEAEVVFINTCAFIEEAKKETIDTILEFAQLKKRGRLKKLIVCGCLVQRYKKKLIKLLPEVDGFIGAPELLVKSPRICLTPPFYKYLKICEGCINNCSYCVIPKIKGSLKSAPSTDILDVVRDFNREGVAELNIIGQDITAYGLDYGIKNGLVKLLEKVYRHSKNIHWLRLLYLSPERITKDLIFFIKEHPRICRYLDIPIQHCSNRILKLMNRRISFSSICRLIEMVRKYIPDICLRTSIIVGFPQETEKEFKQLLNFIRNVQFERLGAFMYSPEEGTPACNFTGQIHHSIKKARYRQLMFTQQEVARLVNKRFFNKTLEVLIEENASDHYLGRTQYDAPEVDGLVYVHSKQRLSVGEFVKVRIIDTLDYDLVGEVINESSQ